MREQDFTVQMNRLAETFGKNAYGNERVKLIWREVKDFDAVWFDRVVSKFIGTCRQAPLMPEFAEECSKERERLWQIEKRQHEQDAEDFWQGTYHPDEVKGICETIRARMQGKVSDADWKGFIQLLEEAPVEVTA